MADLTHYANKAIQENKNHTPAERDAKRQQMIDDALARDETRRDEEESRKMTVITPSPVASTQTNSANDNDDYLYDDPMTMYAGYRGSYAWRKATPEDIKAGYSIDGMYKQWPNGVYGQRPYEKHHINIHTKFKYNAWRRMEDSRKIYSADGIPLTIGKKYSFELTKFPENLEEQQEAVNQLLDATLEYGRVCPEPYTVRWIESEYSDIQEAQYLLECLVSFFTENKIMDFDDVKYRNQVWQFIKGFPNKFMAVAILNSYYKKAPNTLIDGKDVKYITKQINKAIKKAAK